MEELEIQLQSWAPRRPSAKLKRRIFAVAAPTTLEESPAFRFRWLAPATAALVLLALLANPREGGMARAGTNSVLFAVASNYPSVHSQHNGPPSDTFEWTNGNGFPSSIRSLWRTRAQN